MKLFAFVFLVFLSGCGAIDRTFTSWTGGLTEKCHRGIIFVQSDSGLAWLPDKDGKPVPCEVK